jgi:LysM repeat protein
MRWYRIFILLVALCALSFQIVSDPSIVSAQEQSHVVQQGETMFRIALRYGVTVEAVAAANGITDPTRIYAGQTLKIPQAGQQPAQPPAQQPAQPAQPAQQPVERSAGPVYYTVQRGDTLNIISRKFGVSVQELIQANNIVTPDHITPGQQIVIPGVNSPGSSATVPQVNEPQPAQPVQPTAIPPTAVPPQPAQPAQAATGERTHVVKQGEGLAAIGRIYNISWPTIAMANNISDPNRIYAGMVLKIPATDINTTTMNTSAGVPPGPTPPTAGGKQIVVKLSQQRVYAYDNGELLRNVLVSTGTVMTPTVQGDYKIYVKYRAQTMTGPGYYLPGVPWVMYFYQGYSFHGTYWHNNFGRTMSHGCVNMPTDEALWLYNWAEVGTAVHVEW